MNGKTKTIIALLPALAAHLGLFFMGRSQAGQDKWISLMIGLLLLGGILSAVFLVQWIRQRNVERSPFVIGFFAVITVIGYVATFFFTGCLLALTTS